MESLKSKFTKLDKKKKAVVFAAVLIGIYLLISLFFQYHFFPGTEINGYSCGFHSVKKMKKTVEKSIKEYEITLSERDGKKEKITSDQVGLSFLDDGGLEKIKNNQKGYEWITAFFQKQDYPEGMTFVVDESAYTNTFNSLNTLDKEQVVAPEDAFSQYDETENAYHIVEEVYGNTVKKKKFYEVLENAIKQKQKEIDIDKEGCYKNPVYKNDSPEILKSNTLLNRYVSTDIVYDFDDRTQELTGKTIHKWLSVTDELKIKIDQKKVKKYISNMAKKYDTVGVKREFTSIAGNRVTVEGGTYGWKIDQDAEVSKLIKQIKKGKQEKRAPEYEHIAKSRKEYDIGDTYVEVDLGAQYMWYYKDGKTMVSTPVVTGDVSKGRGTPTGVYYILYKTTDYTLTGQGYESEVDYWLPFTQMGVGIHDSSWRNDYGRDIYTYDGSHGCVNTPLEAVKKIYNNIESTYPVVVHW
ncbi:MAG: L,D-transpeptidase/peptidoglycan binding protein [Lachnospiraceae bacterium]|nr:L,D-transpeptidase/peptidoglycan binding protein [Lachnospiraceae bacterium]